MAKWEQGSHPMVQLQPHLRVCVAHGSICSRAGGTVGQRSESLRAGAPALPPRGCCVVPHPSEHPPMASRGLCAPPPPCTRGSAVWGFSPQPRSTTLLSVTPHCLQKSLCPPAGCRLSCSQMAWSWTSVAELELKRRHCVRGRRWGAVGGALGVLGRELPALRAPVLGPWVCRSCGRLEISLSLGWVPGQRLGPGDVVPPPSTWDSGGEKAAWARGACQFVTLRRRGMA